MRWLPCQVTARPPPPSEDMAKRERADVMVVEQGLWESRTRAQALILAGAIVTEDGRKIETPGDQLIPDLKLRLKGEPMPYVSRGGLKLAAALSQFGVDAAGKICLDVGASTGGFTDCLLQAGAARVVAVDVGYGQLAWSLREDPRVVVIERQNIRDLPVELVGERCDLVVIDVSFISLALVLPPVTRFITPDATLVALVKPQFEVGRE